ncbi:MAG: hypothetical protein JJU20_12135 [Opitutales bacterium]|nr:hypothetical protein [Opitutales bacterium]
MRIDLDRDYCECGAAIVCALQLNTRPGLEFRNCRVQLAWSAVGGRYQSRIVKTELNLTQELAQKISYRRELNFGIPEDGPITVDCDFDDQLLQSSSGRMVPVFALFKRTKARFPLNKYPIQISWEIRAEVTFKDQSKQILKAFFGVLPINSLQLLKQSEI